MAKLLTTTKRNILKAVTSFHDPLGHIQPVIIGLKILIQNLCKEKVAWDERLTNTLAEDWQEIITDFESYDKIELPRKHATTGVKVELHGFSDVSFQGYGASVYVRTTQESGVITVKLLCFKSRVAPLKSFQGLS